MKLWIDVFFEAATRWMAGAPPLDVQDGEMRYILHAVGYFIGQEVTQPLSSQVGFDRDLMVKTCFGMFL